LTATTKRENLFGFQFEIEILKDIEEEPKMKNKRKANSLIISFFPEILRKSNLKRVSNSNLRPFSFELKKINK